MGKKYIDTSRGISVESGIYSIGEVYEYNLESDSPKELNKIFGKYFLQSLTFINRFASVKMQGVMHIYNQIKLNI